MQKGSDFFKVFASTFMAGKFYVSLMHKKSIFFSILSIREGDMLYFVLPGPVSCVMSAVSGIMLWVTGRVCLNLNSIKTLLSKVIRLIGKEDGRKKGRESLGS